MTQEVISRTKGNYEKILMDNGQVAYKNPKGQFCKGRAFAGSTRTTTPTERSDLAQEREDELGIPPVMPVPPKPPKPPEPEPLDGNRFEDIAIDSEITDATEGGGEYKPE